MHGKNKIIKKNISIIKKLKKLKKTLSKAD